jgi:tetratricopeptide (TPR) repeat protein
LYNTLGELYMKKELPVLALSYLEDAMYEYNLLKNSSSDNYFINTQASQQPWLLINIGNIFFNQHQFDKALEKYQIAEKNFHELDSLIPKVRGLSTTYNNIALCFMETEQYSKSLEYILMALELRLKHNYNPSDVSHSYKSLCELYYKWKMPSKAKQYLILTDSIYKDINQYRSTKYKGYDHNVIMSSLAVSYIGNCFQYKGQYLVSNKKYKEAIESYSIAKEYYADFAFQKISLQNKIALAYYYDEDYQNCLKTIGECINMSKEKNLKNELEIALKLKIKVMNKLGLKKGVDEVIDEVLEIKDYSYSVQISQLLYGIESKNEILIKKREIEDEKSSKFIILLFSIIAILILVFVVAYLISRKIYVDKQMVIANQKESIAKSDLEHKKRELAAVSTIIVQENEKMSTILKDIKYYVSLINSEKDKSIFSPLLNKLNRLLIDKRKDDNYSEQFSAAYPGYLEYLTRTFPDLTTADLKLCTFLRMNLNTKEIADIMGLSVRSVESRRYRLRKKIGLSMKDDLISYLISLNYTT